MWSRGKKTGYESIGDDDDEDEDDIQNDDDDDDLRRRGKVEQEPPLSEGRRLLLPHSRRNDSFDRGYDSLSSGLRFSPSRLPLIPGQTNTHHLTTQHSSSAATTPTTSVCPTICPFPLPPIIVCRPDRHRSTSSYNNDDNIDDDNDMAISSPDAVAVDVDVVSICDKGSTCGCGLHDGGKDKGKDNSCCNELVLNIPTPSCDKQNCAKRVRGFLPVLDWAPKYGITELQGDAIAGVTVALTVIPQGLAYASVAGLPPQYGLYSAFMGCFVYLFLGTAKDITFGPTAIMSLMVGQFGRGDPRLAVVMTLVAGLIQFLFGLLNLGVLIDFISFPVISAFTSAAAVTIATTQIKSLLGLKNISNEFLHAIEGVIEKITMTRFGDLTIGLVAIVLLYALKRVKGLKWTERGLSDSSLSLLSRLGRRAIWLVCTARNAIIVLTAACTCFALETHLSTEMFEKLQISLTPDVDAGLPPVRPPAFHVEINGTRVDAFEEIGFAGFGVVALVGILESIAIGKAFARLGNYKVCPSQEMVAMGVANVVSSFFSSFPITGSFSRTAVNFQTGVKTPFGGVFTGGVVLLALGTLAPMFKYIPKAALAAVIISSVIPMIDVDIIVKFVRVVFLGHLPASPCGNFLHHLFIDVLPWLATFFGCLFIGLEYGILIGVGLSLLPLLWGVARPTITAQDDASTLASRENCSLVILTPHLGLHFPAADDFAERANAAANATVEEEEEEEDEPNLSPVGRESKRWLSAKSKPRTVVKKVGRRHIIIDGSRIVSADFSVIQMLAELSSTQRRHGRLLVFCNLDSRAYALLDNGLIDPFHCCPDLGRALELIDNFDADADTVTIPLN